MYLLIYSTIDFISMDSCKFMPYLVRIQNTYTMQTFLPNPCLFVTIPPSSQLGLHWGSSFLKLKSLSSAPGFIRTFRLIAHNLVAEFQQPLKPTWPFQTYQGMPSSHPWSLRRHRECMSLQTPRRQSHMLLHNALLSAFLRKVRQSQANLLPSHQSSPKRTLSTKQRAGNTRLPTDSGVTEIKGKVRFAPKLHHRGSAISPVVTL